MFEQVANHLNHQCRHESDEHRCKDLKPLHLFVNGVGGTGKSKLLELKSRKFVGFTATAPTGFAAYNVGGVTNRT